MDRRLTPGQRTFLLSSALATAAIGLTATAGARPVAAITGVHLPTAVIAAALVAMFAIAEQFLMNVEFRRQAHSLTLAGVPLVLGLLIAAPAILVGARLLGALIAFAIQRITADKAYYNAAAYAFEAATAATILRLVIGSGHQLRPLTVLALVAIVAGVDQIMSLLVLTLIRMHNGPLSRQDVLLVLGPAAALSLAASAFALIAVLLLSEGLIGVGLVLALGMVAICAYRGHLSTRRRHHDLTLVHEFVADGLGAASLEALAEQLLSRIRRLLRAASAEVMIIELPGVERTDAGRAAGAAFALTLRIGEDEHVVVGRREVDNSDWAVVRALTQKEPMLAARNTKDRGTRQWLTARALRDALMVALPTSSGLSGTLSVMDRLGETATFTDDDLTLLQTLAGHLAVAIRSTRLVEKLSYDATHDSLTGLSNRAHLTDRIDNLVAAAAGDAAVLLLDLDRFKEVNDLLGHGVGDRLLVVVAERLRSCLPDTATVARLGGDEFAMLLSELPEGASGAADLAEAIGETLACPVHFEEALLTPEASIGVAVTTGAYPHKDLLRQADTAMYQAKANDRRVAVYDPEMDRGRIERLALLADLRTALSAHPEQLVLHYQPMIDLETCEVTSAEALVRWNHPTLGVIGPDVFIPLAESSGLIETLTPLVLETALRECRAWADAGSPISVAINLSARNISDPQLPARIARALTSAGVPAEQLILEITESSVMGDPEQTMPVLHQLHDLGLSLSLDDFGTGYSSLAYLQRLPVDEVKIDRTFVVGLNTDNRDHSRALIRSITGLGANLGLRIVAEGVEDQTTLDMLRALGCHIAQGYHISRPLTATHVRAWLLSESQNTQPRLRLLTAT